MNTVYYTVAHVPGTLILAFFIALLLNQKVKGMPLYRTMFFVPSVVAGVATAILWLFLLDTNWGLINTIFTMIGGGDVPGTLADEHALGDAVADPDELLAAGRADDHLPGGAAGCARTSL